MCCLESLSLAITGEIVNQGGLMMLQVGWNSQAVIPESVITGNAFMKSVKQLIIKAWNILPMKHFR
jgi:hypothetical protein